MITVKQLKRMLDRYPDYLEVIVRRDAEGNSHSPLADLEVGHYVADCSYSGEVQYEDDLETNCLELVPAN